MQERPKSKPKLDPEWFYLFNSSLVNPSLLWSLKLRKSEARAEVLLDTSSCRLPLSLCNHDSFLRNFWETTEASIDVNWFTNWVQCIIVSSGELTQVEFREGNMFTGLKWWTFWTTTNNGWVYGCMLYRYWIPWNKEKNKHYPPQHFFSLYHITPPSLAFCCFLILVTTFVQCLHNEWWCEVWDHV